MQKKGFTLVEVIVAMFIFVAIAAGVTAFAVYYFQSYSFSFEENQSINQAQTSLTRLIKDIREIRISQAGSWPIVDTQDNSFTFYSDVTNDGKPDKVRYFIENSQLKRGVIEPTDVPVDYPSANEQITIITDKVDNGSQPLFKYYNGNWPSDQTNNPLTLDNRVVNTRYVTIYLRINVNTNTGSQPFELTEGVEIRSMKDNL